MDQIEKFEKIYEELKKAPVPGKELKEFFYFLVRKEPITEKLTPFCSLVFNYGRMVERKLINEERKKEHE